MIFLMVRAWHIFLLIVLPVLFSGIINSDVSQFLALLSYVLVFCWYLFIGKSLNGVLPDKDQKNDTMFLICCFYEILFLCIVTVLTKNDVSDYEEMPISIAIFLLLFVLSFFYIIYFVSQAFYKSNYSFKNSRERYGYEVILLFFLIFIVGVWFIQPKINLLYKSNFKKV